MADNSKAGFRCRRCGMIRLADPKFPPWCRHGDTELAAERMEEIPDSLLDRLGISYAQIEAWEAELEPGFAGQ